MTTQTVNSPTTRREVVITAPGRAELHEAPVDREADILIETAYSVISAGTERAIHAGIEPWAPLPFVPGYGAVGTVIHGGERWGVAPGDRVFTFGQHASVISDYRLVVPLPEGIDLQHAALSRMAMVAVVGTRLSEVELGDWVVVQGAGLVGQFAAQQLRLQGGRVIVVDVNAERLAIARECGAEATIDASQDDPREAIHALTGGAMATTVVEATGVTDLIAPAIHFAATGGELILLGSPRHAFTGDALDVFRAIHLGPHVTVKGAIEWQLPERIHPKNAYKHSLERNTRIILDLVARGQLQCAPLLSHVVDPTDCGDFYTRVAESPDGWLGILFDWTR